MYKEDGEENEDQGQGVVERQEEKKGGTDKEGRNERRRDGRRNEEEKEITEKNPSQVFQPTATV